MAASYKRDNTKFLVYNSHRACEGRLGNALSLPTRQSSDLHMALWNGLSLLQR
jgi:hypothetical protein